MKFYAKVFCPNFHRVSLPSGTEILETRDDKIVFIVLKEIIAYIKSNYFVFYLYFKFYFKRKLIKNMSYKLTVDKVKIKKIIIRKIELKHKK